MVLVGVSANREQLYIGTTPTHSPSTMQEVVVLAVAALLLVWQQSAPAQAETAQNQTMLGVHQ